MRSILRDVNNKLLRVMRPTTEKRYKRIRKAFGELPPMPAMRAYVILGEQFGMSDEWIRKILAKKPP